MTKAPTVGPLDPPTPGRLPGRPRQCTLDERRERIVAAATTVFAEKGFSAATMDEVSRRAGMSKRTVYQLFARKIDIFDVLLERWAHPFVTPLTDEGQTQREVLSRALFRLVRFVLDDNQLAISRVLIAEARHGDIAEALGRRGIGRGDWALQQWLAGQSTLGHRPIDDPGELAATIFYAAAGDAILETLLRLRCRPDDAAIAARIDRVVSLYFDPPPQPIPA